MRYVNLETTLKLHCLLRWPAMTIRERSIIKKLFLLLSQKGALDVFEYGMGFSTLYFSGFLKRKKIPFTYASVENNERWFQKVQQLIVKRKLEREVQLRLFPFFPFWDKEGWDWERIPRQGQFSPVMQSEIDYIQAPLQMKKKFDLIIVDGRFRRRCLEILPSVLKTHGIVFLHDSQKDKYHHSYQYYPFSKSFASGRYFPSDQGSWQFWIGCMKKEFYEELLKDDIL